MEKFRQLFEAYGGNYDVTIERFMGNETMYLKFFDMLFQDDNLTKLEEAINAEDWHSAFEAAHTLKGVVGNMGLTPIYDAVSNIVEPLRKKQPFDYGQMLSTIKNEFKKAEDLRDSLNNI